MVSAVLTFQMSSSLADSKANEKKEGGPDSHSVQPAKAVDSEARSSPEDPFAHIQPIQYGKPDDDAARAEAPARFGKPEASGSPGQNIRSLEQSRGALSDPGSQPEHAAGQTAGRLRLMGGITHSVFLPPLPAEQSVGKLFTVPAILLSAHKTAASPKKFIVPNWLAGVWSRTQSTEISRIVLPEGRRTRPGGPSVAIVRDAFGSYKDSEGRIWQVFDPRKSIGHIDRGSAVDYHAVFGYDLVITGPRSAVVEVQASHAVVDKKTKRITSVYQDEELNSYSLIADGQVRTDSSVKVFDMHGKPQYLARSVSSESRTEQFHPANKAKTTGSDKK